MTTITPQANPLTKYFRNPVIYVSLPSKGKYWPEDAINIPANGELPILAMTANDEIMLKTPDALLNGAGVVSIIQSCCPSIIDAWKTPSIDIDALIIAIRIATYGHNMEFSAKCPKCGEEHEYGTDLRTILAQIKSPDFGIPVQIDGLQIFLKPQPYFNVNKTSSMEFEEQQILKAISDENVDPDIRIAEFNKHLARLLDLNHNNLVQSIDKIVMDDGTVVTNPDFISEYFKNSPAQVNKAVLARLSEMAEETKIKPVTVQCDTHHKGEDSDEEIPCGNKMEVDLTFDFSAFFVRGF